MMIATTALLHIRKCLFFLKLLLEVDDSKLTWDLRTLKKFVGILNGSNIVFYLQNIFISN